MGALDFLFEGSPPESVTTHGQTIQGMPKWYSDYTQGLISRANAIAAEPYQAYGGPRIAGLTPQQMQAYDMIPGITQGAQDVLAGVPGMPGGAASAAPFLAKAGRTFPEAADEYMNPYMKHVTDRAGELTRRTLDEQLLPSVERVFGAGGHDPRSSAYRRTVDRGVRELAEGLQGQNLAALAEGYNTSGQIFGQDAGRMGALAQTAGALGLEDIDSQTRLAQTMQDTGLTGAAALEAAGAAQQAQTQRSLDLGYEDFARQRDYPRSNVDWMSSIIRGIPTETSTTTTGSGPADVYQPSLLGQLASAGTAAAGIWDIFKNARGGRIKAPRRVKGALSYA